MDSARIVSIFFVLNVSSSKYFNVLEGVGLTTKIFLLFTEDGRGQPKLKSLTNVSVSFLLLLPMIVFFFQTYVWENSTTLCPYRNLKSYLTTEYTSQLPVTTQIMVFAWYRNILHFLKTNLIINTFSGL